jgi:hypothetical protein
VLKPGAVDRAARTAEPASEVPQPLPLPPMLVGSPVMPGDGVQQAVVERSPA